RRSWKPTVHLGGRGGHGADHDEALAVGRGRAPQVELRPSPERSSEATETAVICQFGGNLIIRRQHKGDRLARQAACAGRRIAPPRKALNGIRVDRKYTGNSQLDGIPQRECSAERNRSTTDEPRGALPENRDERASRGAQPRIDEYRPVCLGSAS